jgi:hypothetical protein
MAARILVLAGAADRRDVVGPACPDGVVGQASERLLARLEALPGPDSKLDGFASGLTKLVKALPDVNVLIFTKYRATQDVLTNHLANLFGKESVDTIHGSKKLDERTDTPGNDFRPPFVSLRQSNA